MHWWKDSMLNSLLSEDWGGGNYRVVIFWAENKFVMDAISYVPQQDYIRKI